jgi:hypothetical protein
VAFRVPAGDSVCADHAAADTGPTLRRTATRLEFGAGKASVADLAVRKKSAGGSPKHKEQKRKPTLIRNLGGVGGPKGADCGVSGCAAR